MKVKIIIKLPCLIIIAMLVAMSSATAQQNNPPQINTIENPIVAVGIPFTYMIPADTFTDPDSDPVTYAITMTTPSRSWLNITNDNGNVILSGTPSMDAIGGTTMTMTAQDTAGNTATATFILNVREIAIVPTTWPLRPDAIAPGEYFRLLLIPNVRFITTVTDLIPYQNHIEQVISDTSHPAIQPFGGEFRVLLSSLTIDARDHIDTGLSTRPGVPIYWLNGDKVADDYDDFYDGDWDSRAATNQYGMQTFRFDDNESREEIVTGSSANGEKFIAPRADGTLVGPIGTSSIILGVLLHRQEIFANQANNLINLAYLYTLSPLFAVNQPPVLTQAPDNQMINIGRTFTYTVPAGTFSDAENHDISYIITAENKPDWLNISPDTMMISGTPINTNDAGDTVITVTATDSLGDSATSSFTLTVIAPAIVPTIWPLKPDDTSLNPGDRFQLLFVTTATTQAQSAQITDYNHFIQDIAANGSPDIQHFSNRFRALISTAAIDARDNTDTGLAARPGHPIYWLNGDKIAANYDDFYAGNWNSIAGTDENGDDTADNTIIWTGSDRNGTGKSSGADRFTAGQTNVAVGQLTIGSELSNDDSDSSDMEHPLYAMSPEFLINYPPVQNASLTNSVLVVNNRFSYTIPEGTFSDPDNTATPPPSLTPRIIQPGLNFLQKTEHSPAYRPVLEIL